MNWQKLLDVTGGVKPSLWADTEKLKFVGALNAYLKEPDAKVGDVVVGNIVKFAEMMQNMKVHTQGALGGTPATQVPDPYMIERYITGSFPVDTAYDSFYKLIDMRGRKLDHFTIDKAAASIVWRQLKTGDRPVIGNLNDKVNLLTVYYLTFGGALGFMDDWWEYEHFWKMEDAMSEFRFKQQYTRAQLAYGLIEAIGSGINQTFDTNLITTIDNACIKILRDLEDQGYGLSESPSFDILLPPELFKAVSFALDSLGNPFAQVDSKVSRMTYSIRNIVSSRRLVDKTKFYVILPEYLNKRGIWKDLTVETDRDIFIRAETMVAHERYNYAIGNTKQFRRLGTS